MIPCIYGLKFPWGTSPRKHRDILMDFLSTSVLCPYLITSMPVFQLYTTFYWTVQTALAFKKFMLTVLNKHDDQLHKLWAQMPPAFHTAQKRISWESLDWNLFQGAVLFLSTLGTSALGPAGFGACSHCQQYPDTACKAAFILVGGPSWQPGPTEPGSHLWRESDFGMTHLLELLFSMDCRSRCNEAPNVHTSIRA